MRIAVNAIFLQDALLEGYGHYVQEIFSRIIRSHPEDSFLFVFDRPYADKFIYAPNITAIVVGPPARHPLAFFWWYQVKAPLAIRSFKPDVWIQPYGFASTTTRVPQLLVVHDLAFLHYPQFISLPQRWYYRFFTPGFLKKATAIVAVSEYTRQDLVKQYKIPATNIKVIGGAARKNFMPLPWLEKESIKEQYADGKDYFLFTGGIHPRKNLLTLLKAFSLFKKWQHSNMKLLIAGRLAWQFDDLLEKLKTYKYRKDVVMLGYLPDEQLESITASAYALVYPSWFEGFGLPVLEAMQSEIPVIASNAGSLPETGGEAALYASPSDPDGLAKHMLSLYKDENLRTSRIEAGKLQAAGFNWDDSADRFYQLILAIAGK